MDRGQAATTVTWGLGRGCMGTERATSRSKRLRVSGTTKTSSTSAPTGRCTLAGASIIEHGSIESTSKRNQVVCIVECSDEGASMAQAASSKAQGHHQRAREHSMRQSLLITEFLHAQRGLRVGITTQKIPECQGGLCALGAWGCSKRW